MRRKIEPRDIDVRESDDGRAYAVVNTDNVTVRINLQAGPQGWTARPSVSSVHALVSRGWRLHALETRPCPTAEQASRASLDLFMR